MEAFHDKWKETLATIKGAEGLIFSLGFYLLTKALLENSTRAGGDAMDILPSDGPLFVVLINPSGLSRRTTVVSLLLWKLLWPTSGALRVGSAPASIHLHELCRPDGRCNANYRQESLARLRAVGRKYDLEGVF
jgi:hypothetical protein